MQLFTATFVKNKCKFLRFLVQQKLALLIRYGKRAASSVTMSDRRVMSQSQFCH